MKVLKNLEKKSRKAGNTAAARGKKHAPVQIARQNRMRKWLLSAKARTGGATKASPAPVSQPSRHIPAVEHVPGEYREPRSALEMYLQEVGTVALLTPKEEVELARRIRKGDEAARERMIKANLRLVVKIAKDYEHIGLPLLDMINEGNIGLMKAVERFDPTKGAKLSTYSSWWIRQQIRRALADQSKTIRLPVHVVDKIYHMGLAEMRLRELLGREATDQELADELKITAARVAELRTASIRPASLEAPIGDDETSRLSDVVQDDNAVDPCEDLEGKTDVNLVRELIEKLPEREARILRLRFGLDGRNEKTLEEVGAQFGLTRERIRQLQTLALTKLRRMMDDRDSIVVSA